MRRGTIHLQKVRASGLFNVLTRYDSISCHLAMHQDSTRFFATAQLAPSASDALAALDVITAQPACQLGQSPLQAVLNAVPGMIAWITADLHYQGVNQGFADRHSHPPDAFIGQPLDFIAGDAFIGFVQAFWRSPNLVIQQEITQPPYTYLTLAQKYDDGQRAVFVQIDISDRQTRAAQLKRTTLDLAQSTLLKDEILANMNALHGELAHLIAVREASLQLRSDMSNMVIHDLRNPLANIMLACNILQRRHPTELQALKLDQIEYSSRQLQCLIDSLLLMAKLEAGNPILQRIDLDLQELGQAAVDDFTAIAAQSEITLVTEFPAEPIWIEADAVLLRRILDNLLTNALKFSPPQSKITVQFETCFETRIETPIGTGPDRRSIKIRVIDQGCGVAPDLQRAIFEKYEIGDQHPGVMQVGLGLAFCKRAVEAHGGQISVHPNQPQGAIFTIELPG
jgi:signal transduction histidine kinase